MDGFFRCGFFRCGFFRCGFFRRGFSGRGAAAVASPAARGKCQGGCQKQNGCAEAEARDSGKGRRWIRVCREVAHAGFRLVHGSRKERHGRYSEPVQRAQAWRDFSGRWECRCMPGYYHSSGDKGTCWPATLPGTGGLRYTGNLGQYRRIDLYPIRDIQSPMVPGTMQDIDTSLLRSFLAVAAEQSVSQGARRLECSQGTMSLRIRKLEKKLGLRLFERGRYNFKLTAAGRDLLPDAQAFLDMHDRVFDRARATLVSGAVRLGVGEGCGFELVSGLLRRVQAHYPNIRFSIRCGLGHELRAGVGAGECDLAILALPEPVPSATVLSRARLHWVARPDFEFREAFRDTDCMAPGRLLLPGCRRAGARSPTASRTTRC